MKKAFSILMIIAVMLPSLAKIGIMIDFKINQDFIAEVLCINRKKSVLTCGGNCYLSKQLKKTEEQDEKQAPTNKKQRIEVYDSYFTDYVKVFKYIDAYSSKLISRYENEFYAFSFIADIFRPPIFNLI